METTNNHVFTTKTGVALTLFSNKDNRKKEGFNYGYVKTTAINIAKETSNVQRDLTVPQFLMLRNQGDKVNPSRVNFFEIEDIQLALLNRNIELSSHTQDQMQKRGYTMRDLVNAIWTGARTELQFHRGAFKAIIEGLDAYGNPINLVIGCQKFTKQTSENQFFIENEEVYFNDRQYISDNKLVIISVMPPILDKFTRHVTHYENKQLIV